MQTNKLFAIAMISLVAAMPSCGGDDDDNAGNGGRSSGGASGAGGVARGGAGGVAGSKGGSTAAGTGGGAGRGGAPSSSSGSGPGGANQGGAAGFAGSGEGGWATGGTSGTNAGEGGGGAGGLGGDIVTVSDAQSLQIVIVANDGEVREGELAVAKASHDTVKVFAQEMIDEHTQAAADARALATSSAITPVASAVSSALEAQAQATITALSVLASPTFDTAYMNAQIATHQSVLVLLDETLLPQAKDGNLRAYLRKMRTSVQAHLTAATQIAADL